MVPMIPLASVAPGARSMPHSMSDFVLSEPPPPLVVVVGGAVAALGLRVAVDLIN